jgi:phosphonate transport system ATP-binding protein
MAAGHIVFDGAPEQLTEGALREIYGDHGGAPIDERMTSTSLPSAALPAMART